MTCSEMHVRRHPFALVFIETSTYDAQRYVSNEIEKARKKNIDTIRTHYCSSPSSQTYYMRNASVAHSKNNSKMMMPVLQVSLAKTTVTDYYGY